MNPPKGAVPPSEPSPREQALAAQTELQAISQVMLEHPIVIHVCTTVSRKLTWLIATSWQEHTVHTLPKPVVAEMASRIALDIVAELVQRYPLHLSTPPVLKDSKSRTKGH